MFLTFSVISFRARRRWHSANAAAEMCPKSMKIIPKSIQIRKFIKNPSQIEENGAQERSERDLESKSVPGYRKMEAWLQNH